MTGKEQTPVIIVAPLSVGPLHIFKPDYLFRTMFLPSAIVGKISDCQHPSSSIGGKTGNQGC